MDTRIVHEGIALNLEMHQAPTELKDGTWFHPARILSHARLADLEKLKTLTLWGEIVQNVSPTNARDIQNGQTVGLILATKKW